MRGALSWQAPHPGEGQGGQQGGPWVLQAVLQGRRGLCQTGKEADYCTFVFFTQAWNGVLGVFCNFFTKEDLSRPQTVCSFKSIRAKNVIVYYSVLILICCTLLPLLFKYTMFFSCFYNISFMCLFLFLILVDSFHCFHLCLAAFHVCVQHFESPCVELCHLNTLSLPCLMQSPPEILKDSLCPAMLMPSKACKEMSVNESCFCLCVCVWSQSKCL